MPVALWRELTSIDRPQISKVEQLSSAAHPQRIRIDRPHYLKVEQLSPAARRPRIRIDRPQISKVEQLFSAARRPRIRTDRPRISCRQTARKLLKSMMDELRGPRDNSQDYGPTSFFS